MMEKTNIIIIVLIVLLVLVVGGFSLDKYSLYLDKQNESTYNQGVQDGLVRGYQTAIIELANQAATCNPVPVVIGNVTFDVIAVDCLN